MTGRDPRFDALTPAVTEGLELPFVERQIRTHVEQELACGRVEVTVVGDVDPERVAHLSRKYLGTIRQSACNEKALPFAPLFSGFSEGQLRSPYLHLQKQALPKATQEAGEHFSSGAWTKLWPQRLHAYVRDSETRAVVHLGGFACNRWGVNPDGSPIWKHMDALQQADDFLVERMEERREGHKQQAAPSLNTDHRKHPAFPRVALWILQELVTKRLFSILREELRLTYEAAFDVMSFDILRGGIFVITVHTQPEEAERVLEATHSALQQLTSIRPLLQSQLEGAKQQVISRHIHDRQYGRYWLDLLGGLQLPDVSEGWYN